MKQSTRSLVRSLNSDLLKNIVDAFSLDMIPPEETAALTLAYIGDAVYEVIIRTMVISHANRSINSINKENIGLVNAKTQAALADALAETFTEAETAQYKRGRNAKSQTSAKNASVGDYRKATGFEAVMGYLYLKGETDRAVELCKLGLEKTGRLKED